LDLEQFGEKIPGPEKASFGVRVETFVKNYTQKAPLVIYFSENFGSPFFGFWSRPITYTVK
jgi:hypothetical protein